MNHTRTHKHTLWILCHHSHQLVLQACNPKYHDFDKTGSICSVENINDTLTQYRWLISAPTGSDGVTSPMREVDTNTFFTNTKSITLDSIYFQAGSRVQCAARAFNANGDSGLELSSPIVVVSEEEGETGGEVAHSHFSDLFFSVFIQPGSNFCQACVSLVSQGRLARNRSPLRSATQVRTTRTSPTSSSSL